MEQMHLSMWKMGRKRLTNQLDEIQDTDLLKRIDSESNSVGWLLRHIAEVELLFGKNVFGRELDVKAQTIGSLAKDRGQFTELKSLMELIERAGNELKTAIDKVENWNEEVTTAEFGTVTKAEALARIMTHTAYHAGQVALARKYGKEY
ncbi:MAG: DinB family protein [Balneolaceae bacterium]|nr:DinB family protein [Balneolaceae bacterium]